MTKGKQSKGELVQLKLLQEIEIAGKDAAENKRRLDELYMTMMEHQRAQQKIAEFSLQMVKEQLRPHRLYGAVVSWDREENQFVCRLYSDNDEIYTEDEDDDLTGDLMDGIVAYGASPSEACDRFDELWLFGRKND